LIDRSLNKPVVWETIIEMGAVIHGFSSDPILSSRSISLLVKYSKQ